MPSRHAGWCDILRAAGVEVWFDQSELGGGDAWDQKIRRQIRDCVLFVPLISANTQARAEGYFRREWKLAVERTQAMADHVAFLLPVVLDATPDSAAHVPEKFHEVQWTRVPTAGASEAFARRVKQLLNVTGDPVVPQINPASPPPARIPAPPARPPGTKRRFGALAALLVLALGATLAWAWQRQSKLRHVHETMLPEIERQIATGNISAAFDLTSAAAHEAPEDPAVRALWSRVAVNTTVDTVPAGADVYVREYYQPQSAWRHLGKAPLHDVRLPKAYLRWKVQKAGYAPLERAPALDTAIHFALDPAAAIPADMVKVGAGNGQSHLTGLPGLYLEEFFIDRYEVTNRQFKAFVDQHGYQNHALWKQPLVRSGQTLGIEAALGEFQDSTGRRGPATWKNGTYADGEADFPVTGISWYEAAAYAEFVGKRLPSIYHWRVAAQVAEFESLVPLSNLAGHGLAPVGTFQGMSAWGTYDMGGNAKEWCWNSGGGGKRFVLGGAWREPGYMFAQSDAQSPFDRSATYGFRCMKLIGAKPLPALVDAESPVLPRNYAEERPVSDEVFQAFRSLYSFDKSPLEARTEMVEEGDARWRLEKISFSAAYGHERVPVYLFLPKNSAPPYQAIIYFPTSDAYNWKLPSEAKSDMAMVAILAASGRAVAFPIYQGTFSRQEHLPADALGAFRDREVMVARDLSRTIDYLETRPDIQSGKLAFFGYSAGGTNGAILPAVETRLKATVLVAAGFTQGKSLPEADPINFAPRNTVPTLMLNGRYDFLRPVEQSQLPLFRLLGAAPENKRFVPFESGHTLRPEQIASEVYVWLDRYLGQVK